MSTDQLRAIYSGEIKNWKDVGGADSELRAFERDRWDSRRETMTRLIMKGREGPKMPVIMGMGMGGAFNRVASDQELVRLYGYMLPEVGRIKLETPDSASRAYISIATIESQLFFLLGNFYSRMRAKYKKGGKSMIWLLPIETSRQSFPSVDLSKPNFQLEPLFPPGSGGTVEHPQQHDKDNWLYGCEDLSFDKDFETVTTVTEFAGHRHSHIAPYSSFVGLLPGPSS